MFKLVGYREDGTYFYLEVWNDLANAVKGYNSYSEEYPDEAFAILGIDNEPILLEEFGDV